jgi:hypothetical protein
MYQRLFRALPDVRLLRQLLSSCWTTSSKQPAIDSLPTRIVTERPAASALLLALASLITHIEGRVSQRAPCMSGRIRVDELLHGLATVTYMLEGYVKLQSAG